MQEIVTFGWGQIEWVIVGDYKVFPIWNIKNPASTKDFLDGEFSPF
jgi:hypothetical protein